MIDAWFQIAISVVIGAITAILADWRGRSTITWFLLGMFFGPFGLLALFLMPKVSQENENKPQELDERTRNIIKKTEVAVLERKGASNNEVESSLQQERKEEDTPLSLDAIYFSDWFYLDSGSTIPRGPLRVESLLDLWQKGSLTEKSWVWCQHLSSWMRVQQIDILKRFFEEPGEFPRSGERT